MLSGVGMIMRPSALRIIFGLLLGVLAAFFIGALPLVGPPKAIEQSSAFALRFSPALPGSLAMFRDNRNASSRVAEDVLQKWLVSRRVNSSRAPDDDPTLIDKIAIQ
jgi:hypothetical protein